MPLVAQDAPAVPANVAHYNWASQLAILPQPSSKDSRLTIEDAVSIKEPGVQIPDFGGALQAYVNRLAPVAPLNSQLPFGGNVVLSLARRRVEIFGGMGGIFVPYASPYTAPNTWLMQNKAGFRVALDPDKHVWLGATTYLMTNFAVKTTSSGAATADLTVNFGK